MRYETTRLVKKTSLEIVTFSDRKTKPFFGKQKHTETRLSEADREM